MDAQRTTATTGEPFTLFLVGVQCRSVRSLWKLPPILRAMARLQGELRRSSDAGLLWGENFFCLSPFTTLYLTYWRSSDHIRRFANDPAFTHRQTWAGYARKYSRDRNLGVWHETYEIDLAKTENIYVGMAPFGMGAFGVLSGVNELTSSFDKRLARKQ